jgi:chromosome partitioning protein
MQNNDSQNHSHAQGRRMRRIAISLLKGGVAKSGTAVSLAHGLAMAGQKVLLVDSDVQAQCSDMLGVHPQRGLAEVVAGIGDPLTALVQARQNLWLLAGGNGLAGVKMEIARREMSPEAVLAEAMEHYEGGFDFLIMDTAPGWDTLLVNALYCSHEVISPVSMEPMALSGLMRFEERLAVIQKYNPQLQLRWVVPTFVDGRVRKTFDILEQLRERYGDLVGPEIKYTVKLSEAPAYGKTIYEHDPKGVGAKSYQKLVDVVLANPPAFSQMRTAAVAAGLAATSTRAAETPPLKERRPLKVERPPAAASVSAEPAREKPERSLPKPAAAPAEKAGEGGSLSLAARLQKAQSAPPMNPAEAKPAPVSLAEVKAADKEPAASRLTPLPASGTADQEKTNERILLSARHFLRERLKKLAEPDPAAGSSFREIREKYKDGRA